MSALVMRVSWNSDPSVWLRACLWCVVLLVAVLLAVPVGAAVASLLTVCCSAIVASVPEILIATAGIYIMWRMKP